MRPFSVRRRTDVALGNHAATGERGTSICGPDCTLQLEVEHQRAPACRLASRLWSPTDDLDVSHTGSDDRRPRPASMLQVTVASLSHEQRGGVFFTSKLPQSISKSCVPGRKSPLITKPWPSRMTLPREYWLGTGGRYLPNLIQSHNMAKSSKIRRVRSVDAKRRARGQRSRIRVASSTHSSIQSNVGTQRIIRNGPRRLGPALP